MANPVRAARPSAQDIVGEASYNQREMANVYLSYLQKGTKGGPSRSGATSKMAGSKAGTTTGGANGPAAMNNADLEGLSGFDNIGMIEEAEEGSSQAAAVVLMASRSNCFSAKMTSGFDEAVINEYSARMQRTGYSESLHGHINVNT